MACGSCGGGFRLGTKVARLCGICKGRAKIFYALCPFWGCRCGPCGVWRCGFEPKARGCEKFYRRGEIFTVRRAWRGVCGHRCARGAGAFPLRVKVLLGNGRGTEGRGECGPAGPHWLGRLVGGPKMAREGPNFFWAKRGLQGKSPKKWGF